MSASIDKVPSNDRPSDSAGAFGFRPREVVVLLVLAGIIGVISLWQWWQKHNAEAARQWSVEDVYVDSMLVVPVDEEPLDEPADFPRDSTILIVDVNTAGARELMRVPGIGPKLAERILASRTADGPFASLEDLQRVRGIGPRTAARMASWLRFSSTSAQTANDDGVEP